MMKMECTCVQKLHTAPVKCLEVSENAVEKIGEILKGYSRIFLVADENTYKALGERAEEILKGKNILSHVCVLEAGALPTNANVGKVLIEAGINRDVYDINKFSYNPDFILAVGSGSINDICRMVSYRIGIEYGVLGTAPSMDGYASVVAPLIVGNKKIIYDCTIARHIIIDLSVCANAPYELLLAGIGDMIGKFVALLDWELSRMHTGEYYCEKIADMVLKATEKCIEASSGLKSRDITAVKNVIDGLILSGLGIAYTGSSRPASGTEHMIGQTWEVMDVEKGKVPNLHGIEVGEATFSAIFMYKKLYEETDDKEIKNLIEKYLPAFDRVLELQKELKLPFTVTDKAVFTEGVIRGRTFRKRYTLLEYLYNKNMLDEYTEYAYTKTMEYNFN